MREIHGFGKSELLQILRSTTKIDHLSANFVLQRESPTSCWYHLTSRGDRREAIFEDDEDRQRFLDTVAERYNRVCNTYCLMGNHYRPVVETIEGNLSPGMQQLNGVYTQAWNRHHGRTGHLFQGRLKGILVDRGQHLSRDRRVLRRLFGDGGTHRAG